MHQLTIEDAMTQNKENSLSAKGKVDVSAMRHEIVKFIRSRGKLGSTCDEAESSLHLRHQTCSPRFTELSRAGTIVALDMKRETRSGGKATVYVVPE